MKELFMLSVVKKNEINEGINVKGVLVKLVFIISLPFLLSSCATVGPDFESLSAPDQETWLQEDSSRFVTEGQTEDWWKTFNDPVLNDLITRAYEENLSLQVAGLRVLEARARLGIAVGNQFPQDFGISGSYRDQTYSDVEAKPTGSPNKIDLADSSGQLGNVGFSTTWEMDLWGKFRRGVEAEQASLLASYASYDDLLVLLTANIASVYVNICTFEERLQIAKQNEAIQQRSLDITRVRFENASTTELDVRRAETLLMRTKSQIPVFQLGISKYKNALAVLLGVTPKEMNTILPETMDLPVVAGDVVVGIPADLIRRRPDIRRAELIAASQSARIGVTKSELFPSFYLTGAVGVLDSDDDIDGTAKYNYALIQPGFSWKILNFGRISNSIRAQDARFQQAIVDYENTVLNAYREVEDSMASFIRTGEQVEFLDKSVKSSERSVQLALIQYRDGTIDYTPVIDTQARLSADQDVLLESKGSVLLSLVDVYRSLGGGWEQRIDREMVNDETKKVMAERTSWGDLLDEQKPAVSEELPESPIKTYTLQ